MSAGGGGPAPRLTPT